MAGLELLFAASLAAQPAPLGWVCARNFVFGDYHGLISQDLTPSGTRYPIRFALWHRRHDVRLEWQHNLTAGPDPGPPDQLDWGVRLLVGGQQALWLRIWADGRFVGRARYLSREGARSLAGQQGPKAELDSINDPAILAQVMRADSWQAEIVGEDGVSLLLRERIPAPAPAAIRATFAAQSAWLAATVERRAAPDCHPIVEEEMESAGAL